MSDLNDEYHDNVTIFSDDPEANERNIIASTYLRPTVMAAASIKGQYKNNDKVNINSIITELSGQVSAVQNGDLGRPEAMLISQVHTLDALFTELISRSRMNMGENINATDKYMKLALKAQNQCKTTIEALAEIKNPSPYIQNNKAQYQQVNNGNTRARENTNQSNELLEDKKDEQQWMDTRTPQKAGRDDTKMETVGTQHRGKDRGGQESL